MSNYREAEWPGMNSENSNLMTEPDMKCVWMTSGIISYKLCSLNFSCENCMFDKVMHNATTLNAKKQGINGVQSPESSTAGQSANSLDGALFYHENHCWVKVVTTDEVVIGLNGLLAGLIYGIKTVVLPKTGDSVYRNQVFAHVLQEKHIVPLIMPVSGVITAVNSDLEHSPELLQTDYRKKGWLVTVKSDNLENELRTLFFGSKAQEWYLAKDRVVREAINYHYNEGLENIGATIQDGGELVNNVSEILTSDQYNKIIEELSRPATASP